MNLDENIKQSIIQLLPNYIVSGYIVESFRLTKDWHVGGTTKYVRKPDTSTLDTLI